MKKCLFTVLIVFAVCSLSAYGQSVVAQSSNPRFLIYDDVSVVSVEKHSSLIDDFQGSGNKARIVVQDILNRPGYEKANKYLTNRDVINLDNETMAAVLFNLDIYGYLTDDGDPHNLIENRLQYDETLHLNNPVRLKINRNQLSKMMKELYGIDRNPKDINIYYLEPGLPGVFGEWQSIDRLAERGEIAISERGNNIFIEILEWPKDDRMHIGW